MMSRKSKCRAPLAVLLKRELTNEKIEDPDILHGQAGESRKGEDFALVKTDCQRVPGDGVTTFSVFALFDGHNGSAAAIYSKENLLNNVLDAIPSDFSRDEWLAALPRALVAGFVKTDQDFKEKGINELQDMVTNEHPRDCPQSSGTTVTFVIIDGWVVTVASVGDSRCILESAEGAIYSLSADHRLEASEQEVDRIRSCGGEVGRLVIVSGEEMGPLRCWPGGLCLSRSIGDKDVGEFVVPIPHVKQVKLSTAGGRIIISSDGVWDALTAEEALSCCCGLPADVAAAQIVKEAVQTRGLRDDTTCIVIDILPPEKIVSSIQPQKKQGKGVFKSMFQRRSFDSSTQSDREFSEPDLVEEIFEEGSAVLAERLGTGYPFCSLFKMFTCAICQVKMQSGKGISVRTSSSLHERLRPWDGPFLCPSCHAKKEAMEGKRPL